MLLFSRQKLLIVHFRNVFTTLIEYQNEPADSY